MSSDRVTIRPATDAGMDAVEGASTNQASIRLHDKCGFRRIGVLREVGRKHAVRLDGVPLQRGPGARSSAPPCRADG